MKKIFFIATIFLLPFALFAEAEDETTVEDAFDFDSVFEDAEDTDAVVTNKTENGTVVAKIGDVSVPLSWSGYMESSFGAGGIRENASNHYLAYFSFLNYLYLNARPDKTLSLHSTLLTSLPSSSNVFSIYEMYFTYLMFDRVFISAGRKSTSWGYVRLIGTVDDKDDKADVVETTLADGTKTSYKYGGVSTNILSDSRSGTSGLIRIPLWTGTISGWAFYADSYGEASNMSSDKLSFALSVEETLFKTSINLFARKYPNDDTSHHHLMGAEIKRTILDADVYAQCIAQVKSADDVFKRHDVNGFSEIVTTAGLYKWWDKHDPHFGFNFEAQDIYFPETSNHNRCLAYDVGLKRLGKRKNIKVGASGYHSITDKKGYVKPGIIFSALLPHADWENGLRIDYGYGSPKFTFGSYLKLTLNY